MKPYIKCKNLATRSPEGIRDVNRLRSREKGGSSFFGLCPKNELPFLFFAQTKEVILYSNF
ncbi:MAG: hypothetical protein U5L45_00195 [Saprospiraceae bacterium]|nr:hypothetical protein [Saprospiraceae bacterium]